MIKSARMEKIAILSGTGAVANGAKRFAWYATNFTTNADIRMQPDSAVTRIAVNRRITGDYQFDKPKV
jgi:hypothetical protein